MKELTLIVFLQRRLLEIQIKPIKTDFSKVSKRKQEDFSSKIPTVKPLTMIQTNQAIQHRFSLAIKSQLSKAQKNLTQMF